jgi:branched-chain amino acid transport system substrate-binding protein
MKQVSLTRREALIIGGAFAAAGLAPRPARAAETYKILSLLDYSGPFANRGKPVEQMQRLLVDWYNETSGSKRGVTLQFDPVDTGYDQAKTVQAYERAVQDPTLLGIVTFGSPNILAIQNRLPENRIPAVHGGPSYSLMKPGSWVFTPLNDFARYYATAVSWRLKSWTSSQPLKVAFATFDGSSGRDWAEGFARRIADMNARIVLREFISPRTLDVAVNVERIIDAKPDMAIIATTDQLQPLVLAELKANKFDMTKVVNSQHEGLGLLAELKVSPDILEGMYEVTTQNYTDTATEAYKIFESRRAKYDTRWSGDTLMHFASVMVLLDAIDRAVEKKRGARINGADVYAELAKGTFDGRGLLGRITFDNEKDPTLGANSVVILQQRGGRIVNVTDFIPLLASAVGLPGGGHG